MVKPRGPLAEAIALSAPPLQSGGGGGAADGGGLQLDATIEAATPPSPSFAWSPPPAAQGEIRGDANSAKANVTEDLVLGGRVVLHQPRVGYRAGLDAALLAAAVELAQGERALEAGCGAGAALLQASARTPGAEFVGLERDAGALALVRSAIVANGMAERVQAMAWDIAQPFSGLGLPRFDAAFANPPFFDDAATLRGPHPAKRGAYLADGGLEAWVGFLLASVRDGGRVTLIHRADRLADLLRLLSDAAGSFRIRPVQPFAGRAAKRVLVRAVKAGRAPLVLLAPLVLHDQTGAKHTHEAEAILRGEASLGWR